MRSVTDCALVVHFTYSSSSINFFVKEVFFREEPRLD